MRGWLGVTDPVIVEVASGKVPDSISCVLTSPDTSGRAAQVADGAQVGVWCRWGSQ